MGTALSLLTLVLFNVERVLLVRSADAERQRRVQCGCRMALVLGLVLLVALSMPVLALYSYIPHAELQCFIQAQAESESAFWQVDRSRTLLLCVYLVGVVLYALTPMTLLPALAMILLFGVSTRLSKDYSTPLLHEMDEKRGCSQVSCSARQQARVAKELVLLSLLATFLLLPNLFWIPWAIGIAINYLLKIEQLPLTLIRQPESSSCNQHGFK